MGLDSGTLGSQPELKAEAQLLSHSGDPNFRFFKIYLFGREGQRKRERERAQVGRAAGRSRLSRKPDAVLHPRTPGS